MCKGETVQRSYLLKYAAKLRITEQACKWTFVGFSGISPTPEAVLRVLQSLFGCLGIQWRNMCFLQKVVGGALSLGGLLLVTFVNI